jgi:AAA+ ATPase superfamily predicted ATPase
MGQNNIVGRVNEMEVLRKALLSPGAEFIAVYGRRRVGKTYLIREFFENEIRFELIGVHDATQGQQLCNFADSLSKSLGYNLQIRVPGSWQEAFQQLEKFLETAEMKMAPGKKVLFFDELPWLSTPRSNFVQSLDHFWNSYASKRNDIIVIICGSAASWMIHRIVRAKGGLHNRLTRQIRLMPFNLLETEMFLQKKNVVLTRQQIAELYMVMGGIPFYLQQVEPGLSTAQIIDVTCFSLHGFLRNEYEKLFSSLFNESQRHQKVMEVLSKKRTGTSRNELLELSAISTGGTATSTLEELEESGFITAAIPLGKRSNDLLYTISDEFSLFHLTWISELGKRDPDPGYWLARQNSPRRRTWSGYAFENLVMKHIRQVKSALGIAMVETSHSQWLSRQGKKNLTEGAQIDLLIDRKDATINICEIKFAEGLFTIDKAYAVELKSKLDVFRRATNTRKNLFLTMITTNGLAENEYSRELVVQSLMLEELFKD